MMMLTLVCLFSLFALLFLVGIEIGRYSPMQIPKAAGPDALKALPKVEIPKITPLQLPKDLIPKELIPAK